MSKTTDKIRPPKGYRLLRKGEVILNGDIFLLKNEWTHGSVCCGERWNDDEFLPTARKIVKT